MGKDTKKKLDIEELEKREAPFASGGTIMEEADAVEQTTGGSGGTQDTGGSTTDGRQPRVYQPGHEPGPGL